MTVGADSRDRNSEEATPLPRLVRAALLNSLQGRRQGLVFSRAIVSRLLLAFALAVTLWVYVTAQENPVHTVEIPGVPIVALGLPTGYVVASPLGTASVRLQGLSSDLHGITASSLQAAVDARGLTPGSPARLLPVTIRWPGGRTLTLLERTPEAVRVGVDVTARTSVQVVVVPVGQPPAGYQPEYAQESIDPPLVTVTGLSSVISHIQRATVEVNLSNAVGTVRIAAVPTFLDATGRAVTPQPAAISPPVVRVTIPVQRQLAFNTLPVVAQLSGTARPGYHVSMITVSPPAVTVFGDPRVFVSLHALTVRVSQEGMTQTRRIVSKYIDLPHGLALSPDEPVTVTLQAQAYMEQADLPALIVTRGASRGWSAVPRPTMTVLRLAGPAPRIAALAGLKVTVNVAGLGAGRHRVALAPRLPAGIHVVSATPAFIDLLVVGPRLKTAAPQPAHQLTQGLHNPVREHSAALQVGTRAHSRQNQDAPAS